MRVFKLIAFGAFGALGLLRGAEVLFFTRSVTGAAFPLAIGLACVALFAKTWKERPSTEDLPD